MIKVVPLFAAVLALPLMAQADPALTIYNQNFAVVRDTVPLTLQAGLNQVQFDGVTSQLEPGSVVLRDPAGLFPLQLVEQSYRSDALTQDYLLWLCEGKIINFKVARGDKTEVVAGKVIRSGYAGRSTSTSPLIEVDGQLQFSLPGQPVFSGLPAGTILKPTLSWLLRSDKAVNLNAELAYITGGINWDAAYNLVAPVETNGAAPATTKALEVSGLVTLTNNSGKTFENVALKLMAGDVNKNQPYRMDLGRVYSTGNFGVQISQPSVTQKSFDDYHLYTLQNRTTLRDRETKQMEFLHAAKVSATTSYYYDGVDLQNQNVIGGGFRTDESLGVASNHKVAVFTEFENTLGNGLGIALPQGRLRFYQRDENGQMEFLGESNIDHTPQGESVRANTGNAFDLVGNRKRTTFKMDTTDKFVDESFEITLRSRKTVPVEIHVLEHLYRGENWAIPQHSNEFQKKDANTIEFRVQVLPDVEKVVSYTVHYTW